MHKILITALHYQLIYSLWYFMTVQLCQWTIMKTSYNLMRAHFFCFFSFFSEKHFSSSESNWCWDDAYCGMSFLHEEHMLWVSDVSLVFLLSCLTQRQIYMQANENWHFLHYLLQLQHRFNILQVLYHYKIS